MKTIRPEDRVELEEVVFARRDGLPLEVEVVWAEELLRRPMAVDPTKPTRAHFHSLFLVEAGPSTHQVDFASWRVEPGHLLVIPAGHVQAFDPARLLRGPMAVFTAGLLDGDGLLGGRVAEAGRVLLDDGKHLHLGDASLRRVRQAFATLDRFSRDPPPGFASEVIASAFSLLVFTVAGLPEMVAAVAARQPDDDLVARFLEQVEARYAAEHRAAAYARDLHVSLRTLDRRLVRARGQTARQVLTARLVLEAKRLLTRRELPIKAIAYELGFSEPQNFTRFFRAKTCVSPTNFRLLLDA